MINGEFRDINDTSGSLKLTATIVNTAKPNGKPIEQKLTLSYPGKTTGYTRNHPGWRRVKDPDNKVDYGGIFLINRTDYSWNGPMVRNLIWENSAAKKVFNGPLLPSPSAYPASAILNPYTVSEMNFYGSKGVEAAIPTSPLWSASQFLGELREGLPKLNREISLKGVADNHVGYQFAVKPLIADFTDVQHANSVYKQTMRQLERDSGRKVRRRVQVRHTVDTEFRELGGFKPINIDSQFPVSQREIPLTMTRITTENIWFSGAFTYFYKPPTSRLGRFYDIADKVYGLELGPELFWNLAPYSWLADWMTNAGTIVSNMSRFAQDGLVMPYGYVMLHRKVEDQFTYGEYGTLTRVREIKQRRPASPFGFGVDPSALNARQWSILGALGYSKGTNAFNKR